MSRTPSSDDALVSYQSINLASMHDTICLCCFCACTQAHARDSNTHCVRMFGDPVDATHDLRKASCTSRIQDLECNQWSARCNTDDATTTRPTTSSDRSSCMCAMPVIILWRACGMETIVPSD